MLNGKSAIIHLIVGLIKMILNEIPCIKMSQYFPKPCELFDRDINVKVDLFNYATKADLKNDTSKLAAKSASASLRAEADKFDIDKLIPVPVDLSKLSEAVKMMLLKKPVYDELVAKLNNIDTSGFVLKLSMTEINQI